MHWYCGVQVHECEVGTQSSTSFEYRKIVKSDAQILKLGTRIEEMTSQVLYSTTVMLRLSAPLE